MNIAPVLTARALGTLEPTACLGTCTKIHCYGPQAVVAGKLGQPAPAACTIEFALLSDPQTQEYGARDGYSPSLFLLREQVTR